MYKSKFSLLLFVLLLPELTYAQALQFVVPDFYQNRLKTIDNFMQRFNREDVPTYLDSTYEELPYMQVVSCFCIDSVRQLQDEVIEFSHTMVDSNIQLGYSIPNYYCELDCKATFNKKKTNIILRMVVEQTPDGSFKWSIADAEGELLKASPNRISSTMRISPIDDDQFFLSLRDVLKDSPENILCYASSSWHIDQTSVFMSLIANKLLKIDSIEDMRYVFFAGGYKFVVQCIDRETNNNGWLICNFEKI